MNILSWLKIHKSTSFISALLLMMLPPIGLFFAANQGNAAWIWFGIALIIFGNIITLLVR